MDERTIRERLDARKDWADVHARLVAFARHRCGIGSRSHAKDLDAQARDLAQTAITRVFAFDSTWDPDKEPDLERFLMSVVNSVLWNERNSAAGRRNVSMSKKDTFEEAEYVADERAMTEAATVEMDLFARRLSLLQERLVNDPRALRVLELRTQGIDSPAEIRDRTGWSASEVTSTTRVMMRAAALVARDLGGDIAEDASAIEDDADTTEDEEVAS